MCKSYFFPDIVFSRRGALLSALTTVALLQLSMPTNATFATPKVRTFGHENIDVVLAADWMLRCKQQLRPQPQNTLHPGCATWTTRIPAIASCNPASAKMTS